jgi:hypothetical protein
VTVDAQAVSINYQAGNATVQVLSTTGNVTAQKVVTANGGIIFTPVTAIPVPVDSSPSSLNLINFSLANSGNAQETVVVTHSAATQVSGVNADASNWVVSYNYLLISLSENQPYFNPIVLRVTPSAGALDTSTASVLVTANGSISGRAYGQYTGDNSTLYGNAQYVTYNVLYNIKSPVIVATKNAFVYAPTANGYTGGNNDPVPGATIVYAIRVQNIGTGASPLVEIIDKIPTVNTDFRLGTATSSAPSTIACSSDNGLTFPSVCTGSGVSPNITHIRYTFTNPLTSGSSATVTFNVVIE